LQAEYLVTMVTLGVADFYPAIGMYWPLLWFSFRYDVHEKLANFMAHGLQIVWEPVWSRQLVMISHTRGVMIKGAPTWRVIIKCPIAMPVEATSCELSAPRISSTDACSFVFTWRNQYKYMCNLTSFRTDIN
jgi:hypothetical protein